MAIFLTLTTTSCSDPGVDHYKKGLAKQEKGDLDGAIAEFTKAIELKPDYAQAYAIRGLAEQYKGNLEGAIADFTKAIELKLDNPHLAVVFYSRGLARQYKGDRDGTMADSTKAIELKPDYAQAHFCRGCLYYDLRNFPLGLVDFRKAIELDSSNDYARFRVWLCRARQGETAAASTELHTYLASRANTKSDDWVSKVGHFLAGQLPEPEFLAAAKNADQKKETQQLCEAYFYTGSKHLLAADMPMAEAYFQKSITTDQKDYTEYLSAAAELRFLTAQKK
jgi:lipoprotein NlpI